MFLASGTCISYTTYCPVVAHQHNGYRLDDQDLIPGRAGFFLFAYLVGTRVFAGGKVAVA
jgi:hypothetical protein